MRRKNSLTLEESSLSSLPSAKVEIEAIRQLISNTMALNGGEAKKEKFSAHLGNYRVLHFAIHGSLSKEVPVLSAIHLSDSQNITVEDSMCQDLRAELVVLSACNTGRGEVTNGHDMIGFARVLLAAGVKSVFVSLWSVDDDVTSFLMTRFYQHLEKEWSPAGTLQAAQLATQQATRHKVKGFLQGLRTIEPELELTGPTYGETGSYSHPIYWAPFITINKS
ncbi:tetratricopeptide repeat domain protein [Fusarium austroafricanum]|uniref:Tetratricopeptide repeat domain protein n=1 Tax=Fusarium austroafricanum TaxID=2364996 RepID=A0A8H4JPT2_9HYPO|nr:tetratricopeptide repeat domain protein [Fusarium austroafricanum]